MRYMKRILLATKNPGKILEYQEIFKELALPLTLVTLKDLDIQGEPIEDGSTFEENALKKIAFYSKFSDLPLIAEDSGLEVDYLHGEPGIHSRRWPGYEATDEELLDMLFTKMKEVKKEQRGAQFRVVVAFKRSRHDAPVVADASIRGTIAEKPSAKIVPGFPFRSIFYIASIGKVLGDLSMEEESKIAHRRIALIKLLPEIGKL